VRGRIGDAAPEFCTACHDATGGNPFLLGALVASVQAEGVGTDARAAVGIEAFGAEAVARALDRRLERLGARELARALAVLGEDAPPREVAALAGLDATEAARLSDALRAAGVLASGPGRSAGARLEFAHPILRAAVLAGLGPAERALWHSRAAELLTGEGAEPERVAVQLLEAEPAGDPAAVKALRAAARAATGRGAPESATAYLRRALAEPPGPAERPAVLLELGLALAAHRHPDSPALLHEAVDSIADPAARGPAAVRAARALGLAALYADVVGICRQTLVAAADLPPDDVARLEAELIGIGMTRAEGHDEIRERVERIRRDPPAVPLWRVVAAAMDTYDGRPARESIALVSPLLREEVLAAERESLVATVVLMLVLIWNDDLDAAKGVADGLLAAARARGWASAVANGSFMRAAAQVRRGEVADAEADIRPSFEFKLAVSPPDSIAWALMPLLDTLVERDELEEAERALASARAEVLTPDLLAFPFVMEARSRLRLAQGRPEEALADARAAAASWPAHRTDTPGLAGWRVCAAEALVALGDTAAARGLASEQLALAERFGAAGPLGAALRVLGRSSPPAEAIAPLERAVALLRDSSAQLEHMRALVELGAALRRRGRREAAREPLRLALHLADRGGAVRLAARAREELRAAGARPRRTALAGRDALTPAERRVVALAAEGHTNRRIAQQLFVTQRTVETHLTHAFAKLDVTSRDQLAAALWPVEEPAYAVT
jgi:DNA-binding CsgD family transcriptional regulator